METRTLQNKTAKEELLVPCEYDFVSGLNISLVLDMITLVPIVGVGGNRMLLSGTSK